ncbi:putative 4-coumarate--CoA ligase-like 8 [Dichanthelium oligosanthes]|uniref:4-coumarate--CoA ligase n=1 Tax=Dichanthelium oligosanthes TaxID=888268 RepID=A0A1E5W5G3_9POAL|nr:putative 4-coumarate--CoA ligase-like 8 [Dichanthelium oligosanthes]
MVASCKPPYTEAEMAAHLTAGYCAATGTYSSRHPPLATVTASSFPEYLFPSLLKFPTDRPAFIDASTGAALSFTDVRTLSLKVATALSALGLRRGHVALLLAPNSLYFPVISLGVLSLGAVLSTANPLLTPHELADQARDSEPFLVLTTSELAPKLSSLTASRVVLTDQLLAGIDDRDAWACTSDIGRDDPALLFYSSGTTGKSKGVVSTHGNVIAAAAFLQHVWRRDDGGGGYVDVYGCVLPMFHMFGFSAFVLGTPSTGATAVLVPGRFSVDRLLAAMEEHRVTRLLVVPPMVVQMAKVAAGEPSSTSTRRLCLREVLSSGAPLQREPMARFRSCFPRVRLAQCYGLTETTGIVTMCDLPRLLHDNDGVEFSDEPSSISIGRLVPSTVARIVDVESGEALPLNRVGELWIRGPSVMQGYLRREEATAAALVRDASDPAEDDGRRWLRTGDLCYVDSRGLVHVVDRIKELIKYKAYQVAPAELEDVLAAHPDIHDVAVAPYPDEEAGEIPVACVFRKPGSNHLLAQDVLSFVQSKVAPYKRIRKVVFVDCIPRSASGKILRAQLKSFLRTCEMHGGAELQCTTRH